MKSKGNNKLSSGQVKRRLLNDEMTVIMTA